MTFDRHFTGQSGLHADPPSILVGHLARALEGACQPLTYLNGACRRVIPQSSTAE